MLPNAVLSIFLNTTTLLNKKGESVHDKNEDAGNRSEGIDVRMNCPAK